MNVPANLKYSNDHEWCRVEGGEAFIGITDFAQSQLGDIVFVDVPTVGETLSAGDVFGSIEASRFRRVSAGSVRMESGIKRYRNVSPTCSVVTVFLFYIRNQYVGLALKL